MDTKELLNGMQSLRNSQYGIAAVYGLQIFEWIANLESEIKFIHRSRWSSIKVAFLLCRYYPLIVWPLVMWAYIGNHDLKHCNRILRPVHFAICPFQFFAQAVMLMRAYAFSGRKRKTLIFLLPCYGALIAIYIWALCFDVKPPPVLFYFVFGQSGCFPYSEDKIALRLGIAMLAAVLMDMASLSVVFFYTRRRSMQGSLGKIFIHQGLYAFMFLFAMNVSFAALYFEKNNVYRGIGLPFILVVANLVACRIILHLKEQVTRATYTYRANSIMIHTAPVIDGWAIGANHLQTLDAILDNEED
ncbi:hypothetical protein BD779DRAFT_1672813 [Infundibulicybe gibba]|nr:hypothetical protein BD779DRAFT_1672813 [Infundibulicybe gibba]